MTTTTIKKTVLNALENIVEAYDMTDRETWETLFQVPSYKTDIDLDYIITRLKEEIANEEEV
jgi:hypothetical protein